MSSITRREFVRSTVLAVAAAKLSTELRSAPLPATVSTPKMSLKAGIAGVHWLEGGAPQSATGTTWGVPWARGQQAAGTSFALHTASGEAVPVQSWPLAYWPDGSLKWTGHALPPSAPSAENLELSAGSSVAPAQSTHRSGNRGRV